MMIGSRGGSRSAARIRSGSPERNSTSAVTSGSAGGAVGLTVRRRSDGSQHRCAIETGHARRDREVGHRVLDRLLEMFTLATQPSFEDADVSRAESTGDEELATGGEHDGEIDRRERVRRHEATSTRITSAPAPFPAQSHATSMSDLNERLVASANGV